ncbi:hypothetical protein [Nonomuraea longicatena]
MHSRAIAVERAFRAFAHDTGHTCASPLAALGVHPRVAMRILRHSQISMTMDVYTHRSRSRAPSIGYASGRRQPN